MEQEKAKLDYYAEQQCSMQWRGFLGALADEMNEQLPVEDLRSLWRRIGERFAARAPLGDCQTIEDLQAAINTVWVRLGWGWASIGDQGDALTISHFCAPLRHAFGPDSANWSAAYLEGVYQTWFSALGVDASLRVRQVSDDLDNLVFRLAR
ncbi:cellulose biosynthesis protein BcsD [Chitinasiproducens palmae]|uniref:Cellulose synthase subunit D n=1 Tax=Chitinasiproducens palmae TaxID=1770053 RepID=A0A1H2PML4_9BURK|nr:cellulose biosynthesis protein BcsD [Chitinasiproducens palmae]SDV47845.1 Cellulose synthase subunit D [Chitinasiproducens palmae]